MEGEVGGWAMPYRKKMGNGKTPLNGKWNNAVEAFQERFSVISVEESTHTQLHKICQGKSTAA
jgi:hypothetical protein